MMPRVNKSHQLKQKIVGKMRGHLNKEKGYVSTTFFKPLLLSVATHTGKCDSLQRVRRPLNPVLCTTQPPGFVYTCVGRRRLVHDIRLFLLYL